MDNTNYASRLQFLDADDVDDSVIDYDGLDVKGPDGSHIGNVDGFIVDADARRAYYIVVDSGGWFTSRRFLLPVGHAQLDTEDRALKVDVTRDALSRYPEFDEDRFRNFTDEDLRAFETRTGSACCPDEAIEDVSVGTAGYSTRRHYTEPEWWPSASRRRVSHDATTATVAATPIGVRDTYREEHVLAHDDTPDHVHTRDEDAHDHEHDDVRERHTHDVADVSPHLDGRAQPGDILGIETGGETTGLGDTAEDENKRRNDVLKD